MLGGDGAIWALGDAATVNQPRALEHAQELFDEADGDGDGVCAMLCSHERLRAWLHGRRSMHDRPPACLMRAVGALQVLTLLELESIMKAASQRYSHLSEHARFLAG